MSRVDISGKAEQGGHGGTEKTNICCWENSLQERDWLHWGPQHRGPLRLHGDLGPDGVYGWVSLGGLSQFEQTPSGEYFSSTNSLHVWTTLRVRRTSCQLCCEVPGFYKVHQPFLDFCRSDKDKGKTDFIWRLFQPRKVSFVTEGGLGASIGRQNHKLKSHSSREYRHHRDAGTQPSWWTTIVQVILKMRMFLCSFSLTNPGFHLCQNSAQDCKSGVWVDFGIDWSQEADPLKISK